MSKPTEDLRSDGTEFSSRDVREMVLRLAHEIRNPLATIKSSIQLIRRLQMSAQSALPHLESALKHVDRIHETMREIERFVSLQEGVADAVPIKDIATKALSSLQERAVEAVVSLDYSGDESIRVAIEAKQLELALTELLENALRFSGQGGRVRVHGEAAGDGMVLIHVEDEGTGVPDEHVANIMRPFFSTLTHGIGLGLNVVQRICDIAGGRLEWENRPESGCRFTMILLEA